MSEYFCECCRRPREDCRVVREFQALRRPGGREEALASYHAELIRRAPAFWAEQEIKNRGAKKALEERRARDEHQDREARQ